MKFDIVSAPDDLQSTGTRLWRLESQYPTKDGSSDDGSPSTIANALAGDTARHAREDSAGSVTPRGAPDVVDYAIGRVRDLFLAALDEEDSTHAIEIAAHLTSCGNPLPSAICGALGLPSGSSYGAGARAVLAKAARQRDAT